ncbi:hypothetical protein ACHHYP_15779 [Achlya hypogyna]|uniref:Uncharacterized protein n=1 Tax=Achlya hypogyna TaxID=1202772 RepID=A0A1V9ZEQ0_ACHHY|nr:hypothetical protein ACHHYP_15779 [Achlya hypogyna]
MHLQQAQPSTASDEAIARQLFQELNRPAFVVAQPVVQAPFNCGACQTLHSVQNARPGCQFTCTQCQSINVIPALHRVVHVDHGPPAICAIS